MTTQNSEQETLKKTSSIKLKLAGVFENSIFKTTKFNILNILLISGFSLPFIFLALDSEGGLMEIEKILTCNPYVNQLTKNDSRTEPKCQQITNLHPTKVLKGLDVSHYQGDIHWGKVADSQHAFAITKATGGVDYIDPFFKSNWYNIRRHGLVRGTYHFFYADDDPKKQAEHFLATVGRMRKMDLPPILDVEITSHTDKKELMENTLIWLKIVKEATKKNPIIYTSMSFGHNFLSDPRFGDYYLWIAEYTNELKSLPKPWANKKWFMWQHSQRGSVVGIKGDVDLSQYKGSLENLHSFIKHSNL